MEKPGIPIEYWLALPEEMGSLEIGGGCSCGGAVYHVNIGVYEVKAEDLARILYNLDNGRVPEEYVSADRTCAIWGRASSTLRKHRMIEYSSAVSPTGAEGPRKWRLTENTEKWIRQIQAERELSFSMSAW